MATSMEVNGFSHSVANAADEEDIVKQPAVDVSTPIKEGTNEGVVTTFNDANGALPLVGGDNVVIRPDHVVQDGAEVANDASEKEEGEPHARKTSLGDDAESITAGDEEDVEGEGEVHQVDEYKIVCELGRGAQGIVYKCEHLPTGKFYAMKQIKHSSGKMANMRTEIAVMKMLEHPNLTKLHMVFDAPRVEQSIFLVMDLIEGGPVMDDHQIVNGEARPLAVEEAQAAFQQMVRGLSFLHFCGVLHRDIKPANVLRDSKTNLIKLSDFGVSTFTNPGKSARVLGEDDIVFVGSFGTPAFMSPEALGAGPDRTYHGRLADVWAAGVTLYAMLCGKLPFDGSDGVSAMAQRIINDPVSYPRTMPKPVSKLLKRMLEKDPLKRIALAGVAAHPWVNATNWKPDTFDAPKPPTVEQINNSTSLPSIIRHARKRAGSAVVKTLSSLMDATVRTVTNTNTSTGSMRSTTSATSHGDGTTQNGAAALVKSHDGGGSTTAIPDTGDAKKKKVITDGAKKEIITTVESTDGADVTASGVGQRRRAASASITSSDAPDAPALGTKSSALASPRNACAGLDEEIARWFREALSCLGERR